MLQRKKRKAGELESPVGMPGDLSSGTYQEMDSLGPQWSERTDSFTKIKEFIRSTGKGVIPSPLPTRFYSHDELSSYSGTPEYATVSKTSNGCEQMEFKVSFIHWKLLNRTPQE